MRGLVSVLFVGRRIPARKKKYNVTYMYVYYVYGLLPIAIAMGSWLLNIITMFTPRRGNRKGNIVHISDVPNINEILTNVGYRFGHQSGLDQSSDETWSLFVWNSVPHLFCVFENR